MRNRATTPLKKAKLRQSWNKFNLYNLSRVTTPTHRGKTFYQQKWLAKSLLRDYHGEQVSEGYWGRLFERRLRSVVPMDPAYLAVNDGSRESAGRGSGLKQSEISTGSDRKGTPHMQMTFAPLERRLDTAIFRAMFASSARQARQFVLHGAVKVNGKSMRHAGYLLNPGDMFQVDSERVMYATGVPKAAIKPQPEEEVEETEDTKPEETSSQEQAEEEEVDIDREPREVLKDLLSQSKSILSAPRDKLGAKRKQDLRAFSLAVKRMLSRSKSSTIMTDSLEAQFKEIQHQLKISQENKKAGKTSLPSDQEGEQEQVDTKSDPTEVEQEAVNSITDTEYNQLFSALTHMQENPINEDKPYATPWMPRDYMSAFAHIPRYLEVNQNICAAVYLRHPVARPGIAELPTPFAEQTNATAFTWYLRRR